MKKLNNFEKNNIGRKPDKKMDSLKIFPVLTTLFMTKKIVVKAHSQFLGMSGMIGSLGHY